MPFVTPVGDITVAYTLTQVLTAPGVLLTDALAFAVEWLIACTVAAWLSRKALLFIFRRVGKRQPIYQDTLFFATFLVAFGAASVFVEGRTFISGYVIFAAPVQALFLLYFFYFPDRRFAPRWSQWLGIIYSISLLFATIPTVQNSAHNNEWTPPAPVLGALNVLGYTVALLPILIVLLPQLYYRYRRLTETGISQPISGGQKRALAGAMTLACFALLFVSGLLSLPATQLAAVPTPLLYAQAGFYLLMTLLPVGLGCALLRGRRYDRTAVASRALVHVPLTLALLLIYAACVTGLWLAFPGFRGFASYQYLPFLIIIVIIMAALFRPLRAFIQRTVDQRVYRQRYDAAQVLSALSASLRDEVQLDPLSKRLVSVVQKAMQPSVTTLWLRTASATQTARPDGQLPALLSASPGERTSHAGQVVDALRLRRQAEATPADTAQAPAGDLVIQANDPARADLLRPSGVAQVERLSLASEAGRTLRDGGVAIALPLMSDGGLLGLLTLGPRQNARPYTVDDCEPLVTLTDELTPLLRAAKQAHEQAIETRQRERIEQELQMARRIQEALLPKSVPALAGWRLSTCYQPAREVGGDFYDFIPLPDGRLGIVLGDVTDKGMPAALVMATTRSMLRAVATRPQVTPGQALAEVNELLCPDLPASMFVTCFYAILDPTTGALQFANAGQDLPYLRRTDGAVGELWAAGMPLGLMPGMTYDERDMTLNPGDYLLFYSDGLVEAHDPHREMFGFPRLKTLLSEQDQNAPLIVTLLSALTNFTGAEWEQEDDITLVALHRAERVESGEAVMSDDSARAVAAGSLVSGERAE